MRNEEKGENNLSRGFWNLEGNYGNQRGLP